MEREHITRLAEICGAQNVNHSPDQLSLYAKDWTYQPKTRASIVVFPSSTQEVADVMKYCHEHALAVVPSGGRTGLAGGAVALKAEVVLSLDRMNKILNLDPVGMYVEVEAGVTTQAVQEAAKNANTFFALDLAAKGSSQIGGNIATNAGGLKLIKYGGMREQVLGIEAVLADGTIVNSNRALRKNNTGFDLKQLFIASEGTLGIITKATLRLCPRPKELELALLAVDSFELIPRLLSVCSKAGEIPTAFEFFDAACLARVLEQHSGLKAPFSDKAHYYVLLEMERHGSASVMEGLLETAFEDGLISDGVIAGSSRQFHDLWSLRENISESLSSYKFLYKNDIAVPVSHLAVCVDEIEKVSRNYSKNLDLYLFGHIGDGNIHLNYGSDSYESHDRFIGDKSAIEKEVFSVIKKLNGTISAEHGIGLLKKSQLDVVLSETEMAILAKLKKALDPKGILNPGKILPS